MNSDNKKPSIKKAVFLGSKKLGLEILEGLLEITPYLKWTILHPDDESDGRSVLPAFNRLAHEHNADFLICQSAGTAGEILREVEPDIGFVCGWYWLLSEKTLDLVEGGLWGIHNSLLPKYRGGAPLVWSIINGDSTVGSTVFRITPGMDDGPVLHQVRVPLATDENVADALTKISQNLVAELPSKWAQLMLGGADLRMQLEEDATFCGQRTEEDGAIDWFADAAAVHDFVRAQAPPYPGAFTFLRGEKIKVLRTRLFSGTYFGTPGQVLRRLDGSIIVSCAGHTALEILTLSKSEDAQPASALITSIQARFSQSPA